LSIGRLWKASVHTKVKVMEAAPRVPRKLDEASLYGWADSCRAKKRMATMRAAKSCRMVPVQTKAMKPIITSLRKISTSSHM
jgi:hypothetical protein